MMEDEDKKTGELLTNFRDLTRGFRLDTKSEAAVRQIFKNKSSIKRTVNTTPPAYNTPPSAKSGPLHNVNGEDEKVKPETEERFYDVLAEKRSCLHQTGY